MKESLYPVLDNRPIDQWKVTELKEELRRRKLTTRGLKEELIRRLDEAIRNEDESSKENADNGFDGTPQTVIQTEDAETVTAVYETTGDMRDDGSKINEMDGGKDQAHFDDPTVSLGDGGSMFNEMDGGKDQAHFDDPTVSLVDDSSKINEMDGGKDQAHFDDPTVLLGEGKVQKGEVTVGTDSARDEEIVINATSVETIITVSESVVSEIAVNAQDSQNGREGVTCQLENEIKPPHEDIELKSSDPKNQVSEVSVVLGFQVKSDSISSDCVSNNEKNELKDNIIADNVKLELDVKPEMVQPSSSNVHPDGVEKPHENKVPVEEGIDNEVANTEMIQKNNSAEVVSSEKLNFDRSSGDDSMEDDALESKLLVSKYDSDEVVDRKEKMEVPVVEDEAPADDMQDDIPMDNKDIHDENINAPAAITVETKFHENLNLDQSFGDDSMEDEVLQSKQIDNKCNIHEVVDRKVEMELPVLEKDTAADDKQDDTSVDNRDTHDENKNAPGAPTLKRKLHDQEEIVNIETSKRHRRWNSEYIKVPEPQSSMASSTTPKDAFPSSTLKRNFSRSNSTASDDAPKDRVVPPSPKPPTNSLRIDHFLRPFTLKAVQELLGKTGTVSSFWMDHIKTHCYVTYSSLEEAIETRKAVYNLQWPSNGGRLLVAEFVDPQEVKMRVEAPPQSPATPVSAGPTAPPPPPTLQPQPSPRQLVQRQQLPPLPTLPPPPPLSNPPQARERLPLPPPPPHPEKLDPDPPIVTLDDLFKKTKATPRIYYLPLSDEQVAAKMKSQGNSTKQ